VIINRPTTEVAINGPSAAVVVIFPKFRIYVFPDAHLGIECRTCEMLSHNPHDVIKRYCGHCHVFHDDQGGGQ